MGQEIIELGVTDQALADLKHVYGATQWDCAKKAHYESVRKGIGQLRGLRNKVDKRRLELKRPLMDQGKKIDKEAKRIIAVLEGIEDPLKEAKALEDNRVEEERKAAVKREAERQSRITEKIQWIIAQPGAAAGCPSEEVRVVLEGLRVVDTSDCEERQDQAEEAREQSLQKVEKILAQAIEAEEYQRKRAQLEEEEKRQAKERMRIKVEAEAQERQRQEFENQKEEEEKRKAKERGAKEKRNETRSRRNLFRGEPDAKNDAEPKDRLLAIEAMHGLFDFEPDTCRYVLKTIIQGKIPHVKWTGE